MVDRDTVFVVGGGPSLSSFNLSKLSNYHTICINQSVFDIPNPDYLITCDYTFLIKLGKERLSTLSCTRVFVANFIGEALKETGGKIIDPHCNLFYDLSSFDTIIKARNRSGIGGTFRDFRSGGNSGYCGFQLAVLLGYKKIVFVGIDLTIVGRKTHYHSVYTTELTLFKRRLDTYYAEFKHGIDQVKRDFPNIKMSTGTPGRLQELLPLESPI